MCSICGLIDFKNSHGIDLEIALKMGRTMTHRGIDQSGVFMSDHVAFQHNRLSVIDLEKGKQPMTTVFKGNRYTIVYNGEIYNCPQLRMELSAKGVQFKTNCDTEVVLYTYIIYKEKAPQKLNGIFAFAVYDEFERKVFLARDRFGIKPMFYTFSDTTFLFASEIKALLAHNDVKPVINEEGLWQLIYLNPVKLKGSGIFKDIHEVQSGECGYLDAGGLKLKKYWELKAQKLDVTSDEAAQITKELLEDSIKRQLVADVPLGSLLSGGLDSSVITAVAAKEYEKQGRVLDTFSFEYEGNKENFKQSLFQPQRDDEFALLAAKYFSTNHSVLTVPTQILADYLIPSTIARDMPGQADIDSSLYYFCEQMKKTHTVGLSGECSDEIFGGYPWYYRAEMLETGFFPFIHKPTARASLFNAQLTKPDKGYLYMRQVYQDSVDSCPVHESDNKAMRTSRIATWLTTNYFMASLLERKDRMSMASSVEVRVPFADHRIIEFVYNVPWEIKFENNVEKALLRNAMKDYLPEQVLNRKKSPYPKTHNPVYEQIVTKMLEDRIKSGGVLNELLDLKALEAIKNQESVTWFGQLMAKPQLYAWLIQLDYWFEEYKVKIV